MGCYLLDKRWESSTLVRTSQRAAYTITNCLNDLICKAVQFDRMYFAIYDLARAITHNEMLCPGSRGFQCLVARSSSGALVLVTDEHAVDEESFLAFRRFCW